MVCNPTEYTINMFKIIVFVSFVAMCYSAVHFQPYQEKPAELADQEGCYIPELKRVVPYDEPYRPADGKPCAIYMCSRNNETQIHTCGNAAVPDGCELETPADDKMTAENCCGIIKCGENNEN